MFTIVEKVYIQANKSDNTMSDQQKQLKLCKLPIDNGLSWSDRPKSMGIFYSSFHRPYRNKHRVFSIFDSPRECYK